MNLVSIIRETRRKIKELESQREKELVDVYAANDLLLRTQEKKEMEVIRKIVDKEIARIEKNYDSDINYLNNLLADLCKFNTACESCNGTGRVKEPFMDSYIRRSEIVCPTCKGCGRILEVGYKNDESK